MKKLKSLLLATLLIFGGGLFTSTASAQSAWTDGRIDAYTKPNPANPVTVSAFIVTPLNDGTVAITFVVSGIGRWQLWECCLGQYQPACLLTGVASMSGCIYTVTVPAANFGSCWIDISNVHGWSGTEW